jgi:hypothetical protein
MKLHDYAGVIHFHSSYSFDGRSSISEILAAAAENDLDFLMLTDHFNLGARDAGLEGWHGSTLLIVGEEISRSQFNHYLAFGLSEPVNLNHDEAFPQRVIDRVCDKGGFGFIAHPDHEGTEMFHVKPFPWVDWEVTGYAGIGIWDFMTDWQSSLKGYGEAMLGYLWPALFLNGPRPVTLRRWDDLNRKSRVVGIGELDNHNTRKSIFGVNLDIFPFRMAFRFVRTHLLTGRPLEGDRSKDMEILFDALKKGRVYVAQEYFQAAKGFSFRVTDGTREASVGDEFFLGSEAKLKTVLPCRGKIRIVRDGELFHETIAESLECTLTQGGIYRVEAYFKALGKYRPWIFSNPIYIRQR